MTKLGENRDVILTDLFTLYNTQTEHFLGTPVHLITHEII